MVERESKMSTEEITILSITVKLDEPTLVYLTALFCSTLHDDLKATAGAAWWESRFLRWLEFYIGHDLQRRSFSCERLPIIASDWDETGLRRILQEALNG